MTDLNRMKLLLANYIDARRSGHLSGYHIAQIDPDDFSRYVILIQPKSGLYKGQSYILNLKTDYGANDKRQFPINPPLLHFESKVFHANISLSGSICLDILNMSDKWLPSYGFDAVIQSLLLLFEEPNGNSPLNDVSGSLHTRCTKEYNSRKAANMTVQQLDALHADCFKPFVAEVNRTSQSNDLAPYYKYFPMLNPYASAASLAVYQADFDELVASYEAMRKKKAPISDSKEEPKSAPKAPRWAKHQK